ncbi:MAG TPA: MarR family transcriptional regulator [Clostridia bacterium]|jgi:DNA-binding MarR family transcriptional regulator|nr:MAG: transcriptional repressor MprA [Firmicutes bacterium ADurb.Bin099]HNZ40992.1 MarR family transcriptional regulator [Clostridia bacterium]HPY97869.1 MarR family transcriptional regulator [Clostridia bacterium]HQC67889.1 MarR family transcriptional regulator [Clostridia bacterium]
MTKQPELNEALLNAIHRFTVTLRRKRISADIIFHEFLLLRKIQRIQSEKNDPVYPSDLSDKLNLSKSYITAVLNSLEKKELIVRTLDTADRRRLPVRITDKGRQIFDNMAAKELEQTDILVSGLTREKTLNLISLLNQASDILDKGE